MWGQLPPPVELRPWEPNAGAGYIGKQTAFLVLQEAAARVIDVSCGAIVKQAALNDADDVGLLSAKAGDDVPSVRRLHTAVAAYPFSEVTVAYYYKGVAKDRVPLTVCFASQNFAFAASAGRTTTRWCPRPYACD